jgi:hypothetical protein
MKSSRLPARPRFRARLARPILKPVRLIIRSAGGSNDVVGRLIGQPGERLGQSVV